MGPDARSTAGTPRRVYVLAIVALVELLLVVVLPLAGGHDPGRHM